MSGMFSEAHSYNQSLNSWDVNNVINIYDMFVDCPISEKNKPLFKIDY